ncbi:Rhodopsin orphan GPCR [Paragonimus kellicotti]|nr:Rhodopsin orphan GPCR [Paragonimus kellicotti]
MFDGAFWIEYASISDNCTTDSNSSKCDNPIRLCDTPLLSLSLLALILNITCMYVFARHNRRSVMRSSLLLLSATEVVFHLFFSIDYMMRLGFCTIPTTQDSLARVMAAAAINLGSDTFLCTRNWCNVLITSARTEVIVVPLRTRRYFTRKSIVFIYALVLFLSFGLSIVRVFYEYVLVCQPSVSIAKQQFIEIRSFDLLPRYFADHYDAYCFFIYQVILPVILVLSMSITIASYVSPWRQSAILEATSIRRRHQMNATRTVLLMALTFLCCQMPTFIFVILDNYTDFLGNRTGTDLTMNIAHVIADVLLLLDSVTSIMIYSYKLPGFRNHLICLHGCQSRGDNPLVDNTELTVQDGPCRLPYINSARTPSFHTSNKPITGRHDVAGITQSGRVAVSLRTIIR